MKVYETFDGSSNLPRSTILQVSLEGKDVRPKLAIGLEAYEPTRGKRRTLEYYRVRLNPGNRLFDTGTCSFAKRYNIEND